MRTLIFIVLATLSIASFAVEKIETIQLNHRLASEVLPEVQAMLPERATARAFNELIIIKAEKNVIENIRLLINKLDTPPQRILITVLRTYDTISDRQNAQLSGDVVISNDDRVSGQVALEGWSTKDSKNDEHYYQARGIAGRPILISMGEDIPQQEQYLVLRPDGDLAVQSTTQYININSGFEAVARLLPNHNATIEIHPTFGQQIHGSGAIQHSQMISSVSGPIGSWLEIGQLNHKKNIEKQGTTSYHSHQQQNQSIYIKVDQVQ